VPLHEDTTAAIEWKRYERVKALYTRRNERYRTLINLLGGNFYSPDLLTTISVNDDAKREIEATTGRQLIVNRLAVVVRNFKNFLSEPPEIEVPPRRTEAGEVDEDAERHADRLTKLLYATWYANQIETELQAVEHYTSGLGLAPLYVWPDMERNLMSFTVLRPWAFYPMPYGSDYRKFRYVCTEDVVSGEELLGTMGAAMRVFNPELPGALDPDRLYLVVNYYTEDVHSRLVSEFPSEERGAGEQVIDETPLQAAGPQTLYRVKNPMGFVPFLAIPGSYIPHQVVGESDIEQAVGLSYYVNDMLQTEADIMAYVGNPILVLTGTSVAAQNIPNEPGAALVIPEPGARAQFLVPPNISGQYFERIQRVMAMIEDQTTQPAPVQGRVQPGIRSGAAIQALMGSMAALVATKQRVRRMAYRRLNEMLLKGYERVFGNVELDLQGSMGGGGEYFNFKMKGKDIDGWYANDVIYREGLQDSGTRLQTTMMKLQAGLISKRTARKEIGVRSPREEEAQIRFEQAEEKMLDAVARGGGRPAGPRRPSPEEMAAILGGAGAAGGPSPEGLPEGLPGGLPGGPPGAEGMPEGLAAMMGPNPAGASPTSPRRPAGERPVPTQEEIKARVKKLALSGKVFLKTISPDQIVLAVTRASDEEKLREALTDLGVPIRIQVVGGRPEGSIRLRGR
jgi:hypothetical protein